MSNMHKNFVKTVKYFRPAKRLAEKNVSEMTYFVSSGTLNLAPSIHHMLEDRHRHRHRHDCAPPYLYLYIGLAKVVKICLWTEAQRDPQNKEKNK